MRYNALLGLAVAIASPIFATTYKVTCQNQSPNIPSYAISQLASCSGEWFDFIDSPASTAFNSTLSNQGTWGNPIVSINYENNYLTIVEEDNVSPFGGTPELHTVNYQKWNGLDQQANLLGITPTGPFVSVVDPIPTPEPQSLFLIAIGFFLVVSAKYSCRLFSGAIYSIIIERTRS